MTSEMIPSTDVLETDHVTAESHETTATEEHAEEGHESTGPHIQLAAEPAFEVGHFTVTNTMVATVVTTVLILIAALAIRFRAGVVPSRLQVVFELVFMEFYDRLTEAVGEKKARQIVPLIVTLFMFVLLANSFILIPFVGSFVTEHGHFMRTPTTDYSMTVALALITMGAAHFIAFVASPVGHILTYFRVDGLWQIIRGKKPLAELFEVLINLFLGFLEILGDLVKVISLGTRLFGNILAGEVVIMVISGLMFATQFFVPIPFILLASFAGLIQAFVFALLSTIFISNNFVHATHNH
ncbi:F0F1 ATP synthase subunit A [Candidatus Peregrinibacteria bacterium]|nr:MAG: F0F1 ATP synthase subunit A [Candidatus Peregrinibacteria bacterium]